MLTTMSMLIDNADNVHNVHNVHNVYRDYWHYRHNLTQPQALIEQNSKSLPNTHPIIYLLNWLISNMGLRDANASKKVKLTLWVEIDIGKMSYKNVLLTLWKEI